MVNALTVSSERPDMTTANTRARRIAAIGALAVAAVPALAALTDSSTSTTSATGTCLAWVGSRNDGQCISWSNGSPTYIGTPQVGLGGPNSGSPGLGITTGPMLPGQTINIPLG
jgi:hypothetical protein